MQSYLDNLPPTRDSQDKERKGWELVWEDNFDYPPILNQQVCEPDTGLPSSYYTFTQSGLDADTWIVRRRPGNWISYGQSMFYRESDHSHDMLYDQQTGKGKLRIRAERQDPPFTAPWPYSGAYDWTSTWIQSRQRFKYGYFEMKGQLMKGQGFWPAFWILGGALCDPQGGNTDAWYHISRERSLRQMGYKQALLRASRMQHSTSFSPGGFLFGG